MGRFGVKVALPSQDARTSPDNRMAFASAWPTLKIFKEGSFSLPAGIFSRQNIFSHGLGYAPMFWIFFDGPSTLYPAGSSHFFNTFDPEIVIDDLTLYAPNGGLASAVTGRYVIFTNPLEDNYTAPIDYSGVGSTDSVGRYGIKAAKRSKEYNSKNIRELTIDSNYRTPLIHSVKSGTMLSGKTITVEHNLGEIPEFFAYAKIGTNSYWQIVSSGDDSFIFSDNNKFTFLIFQNCAYSLWVLKQSMVKR
jgi:hypothetical protein